MTDPIVTLYDRLVTLLKSEPTLYDASGATTVTAANKDLVRHRNLIVYSGSQPHPEKQGRNDGDFPELDLDEAGYLDSGYTKFPTFCSTSPGGTAWIQEITQVFEVTLTGRDYRLEPISRLRFAVSLALSRGGQRLGLPSTLVKQWGPITGQPPGKVLVKSPGDGAEGGTSRRQLKILIPVVVRVTGTDLQT
jgi:hypothetical protein